MGASPIQVLQGASRPQAGAPARQRLLIAGATGVLGAEVVRRLVGVGHFGASQVLAREPMRTGLRGVEARVVAEGPIEAWPPADGADVAVVLFEPPRLFFDRERALWTPTPEQLLPLARWLRAGGVHTLAVVLPHAPGSLDEQAVASLGFQRLLLLRSAQKPAAAGPGHALQSLARFMLSVFRYMVPSAEQPVRAAKVAELLGAALRLAPPGIHVAAPEVVWQAAQGDAEGTAKRWLLGAA